MIKKILVFVFVMQGCFDLDSVTDFLNTLTRAQAATAKVVAINSQRSFLGVFSKPYYVWYDKDAK